MFSPCEICFQRYGKQYSEECDKTCEYAKLYKALSDILEYIKDREEHHASQWSYKRAFNYEGAAMQHVTLQSELSTILHYIDKNILSKYGVMENQMMDTQPCVENKPDYNDILSYIDKLLNQATGKKKSLEFLKKYIEGSTNTASNHVEPVTNTTTYTNATDRTYTTSFATGFTIKGSDIADVSNYTISAVYNPHKSVAKPPITVGELIKLLNDFPQDMPVGINFQPYSEIEIGTMTWTDDNYPYEKPDFDYVNIQ